MPADAMTGGCLCGAFRWSSSAPPRDTHHCHCGICGTPLYLKYDSRADTAVAAGTLDNPQAVTPTHHYGVEGRLAWADIGADLPGRETRETW
jgi:hypothetical protein